MNTQHYRLAPRAVCLLLCLTASLLFLSACGDGSGDDRVEAEAEETVRDKIQAFRRNMAARVGWAREETGELSDAQPVRSQESLETIRAEPDAVDPSLQPLEAIADSSEVDEARPTRESRALER